jgi:hypothetical protein
MCHYRNQYSQIRYGHVMGKTAVLNGAVIVLRHEAMYGSGSSIPPAQSYSVCSASIASASSTASGPRVAEGANHDARG